jgi:hypothetical protein
MKRARIPRTEKRKDSESKEEKGFQPRRASSARLRESGVVQSSENSWVCRRSWAQPRRDSAEREDSSEVYYTEL